MYTVKLEMEIKLTIMTGRRYTLLVVQFIKLIPVSIVRVLSPKFG